MRFIFTVLFLVSFGSVSMGDLGDVYVCESVQNIDVSHLKIADNRKLKFKFMVLDRFINFSKDSNPGHFLGLRLPVRTCSRFLLARLFVSPIYFTLSFFLFVIL